MMTSIPAAASARTAACAFVPQSAVTTTASAGRDRRLDAGGGEVVAILEPAGHERHDAAAECAERPRQERGGRHAVDVVVAVDEDHFALLDRLRRVARRRGESAHQTRIVQLIESRPQETLGRCGLSVAPGVQQPADGDRQMQRRRRARPRPPSSAAAGRIQRRGARRRGEAGDCGRRARQCHTLKLPRTSARRMSRRPRSCLCAAMTFRRCRGTLVSQCPHDGPRSGKIAPSRRTDRIRSYFCRSDAIDLATPTPRAWSPARRELVHPPPPAPPRSSPARPRAAASSSASARSCASAVPRSSVRRRAILGARPLPRRECAAPARPAASPAVASFIRRTESSCATLRSCSCLCWAMRVCSSRCAPLLRFDGARARSSASSRRRLRAPSPAAAARAPPAAPPFRRSPDPRPGAPTTPRHQGAPSSSPRRARRSPKCFVPPAVQLPPCSEFSIFSRISPTFSSGVANSINRSISPDRSDNSRTCSIAMLASITAPGSAPGRPFGRQRLSHATASGSSSAASRRASSHPAPARESTANIARRCGSRIWSAVTRSPTRSRSALASSNQRTSSRSAAYGASAGRPRCARRTPRAAPQAARRARRDTDPVPGTPLAVAAASPASRHSSDRGTPATSLARVTYMSRRIGSAAARIVGSSRSMARRLRARSREPPAPLQQLHLALEHVERAPQMPLELLGAMRPHERIRILPLGERHHPHGDAAAQQLVAGLEGRPQPRPIAVVDQNASLV